MPANLTDSDLMQILLNEHKSVADSLTKFNTECAHSQLRGACDDALKTTFSHQKQVFDLMSRKGWYHTHPADTSMIAKVQQEYNAMQVQGPIV